MHQFFVDELLEDEESCPIDHFIWKSDDDARDDSVVNVICLDCCGDGAYVVSTNERIESFDKVSDALAYFADILRNRGF